MKNSKRAVMVGGKPKQSRTIGHKESWVIYPSGRVTKGRHGKNGAIAIPRPWVNDIRTKIGLGTKLVYHALSLSIGK